MSLAYVNVPDEWMPWAGRHFSALEICKANLRFFRRFEKTNSRQGNRGILDLNQTTSVLVVGNNRM